MAIKIYIDQGHNPQNPNGGAEGSGYREQDITFRVGRELYELFSERGGFEVRLSRPEASTQLGTSNSTSLSARTGAANAWGADYFISIHTNAASSPSANGSEVLVFSEPSVAADIGRDILYWLQRLTGFRDRGVKVRNGLYVLRRTAMPAVLVELGFITNPEEARLMAERPELFAVAIFNGMLEYLGLL